MSSLAGLVDTDVIGIDAWRDPLVDAYGHDPRSLYVETFWLPVLGPSTTLLLRRLAACLEASPTGTAINVAATSRALGLGERTGRNGPLMRTVARMVDFEMARLSGPSSIAVRTSLPPLPRRHVARLPEALRDELALLDRPASTPAAPGPEELRRRARQLAMSLADLGEDEAAVERQLLRWRVHPALARECATWAARAHAAGTVQVRCPATSISSANGS
jgi:hypothetical protein